LPKIYVDLPKNYKTHYIMKKAYYTLLFLLATTVSIAQGIAVQGIARDNASSAIADTSLTFTFSITKDDNTVLYAETQSIKTDNFGVFSHIVSTGNPNINTFNDVDFALEDLKLKVSVNYNGNTIEVYNQAFQYTPYAHFAKRAANADDGVPTGAIMPFIGTVAPVGWVLCKGQSITAVNGAAALRVLVGNNAPNLQGTFLRGTGTSPVNSQAGPALKATQSDVIKSHKSQGATNESGVHNHPYYRTGPNASNLRGTFGNGATIYNSYVKAYTASTDAGAGKHAHSVDVDYFGASETRPVNYGVNYIIKL
jgi:microcystin-dependent protein